jgi:cytidylate kinase
MGLFHRRNSMATGRRGVTSSNEVKPVVTLAALYGAGDSVIGPRVAERLGVPFLDREIPEAAAARAGLSTNAVAIVDEKPRSGGERWISRLGRAATILGDAGGDAEDLDLDERRLRGHVEEFLYRASMSGGVALGRGGMVVLRDVPHALHVQLQGPREARVRQGMEIGGIDRQTAERRQELEDEARVAYVRRAYGVDGYDASQYHLVLDSTALDLDTCVELIVAASKARTRDPRPAPVPE